MLTNQSVELERQPIHKMKSPTVSVILSASGFANSYIPAGTIIGASGKILDDLSLRGVNGNVAQGGGVIAQGILTGDVNFNGQEEVVAGVSFECVVYTSKIEDANGTLDTDVKTTLEASGITFYAAATTAVN